MIVAEHQSPVAEHSRNAGSLLASLHSAAAASPVPASNVMSAPPSSQRQPAKAQATQADTGPLQVQVLKSTVLVGQVRWPFTHWAATLTSPQNKRAPWRPAGNTHVG